MTGREESSTPVLTCDGFRIPPQWRPGVILIGEAAGSQYARFGWLAIAVGIVLVAAFSATFRILAERGVERFRPLRPQHTPTHLVMRRATRRKSCRGWTTCPRS